LTTINLLNGERKYTFIPYRKNVSEVIASALSNNEFIVDYRCLNKLGKFIKVQKNRNIQTDNNNVIYKVFCKNHDASYKQKGN